MQQFLSRAICKGGEINRVELDSEKRCIFPRPKLLIAWISILLKHLSLVIRVTLVLQFVRFCRDRQLCLFSALFSWMIRKWPIWGTVGGTFSPFFAAPPSGRSTLPLLSKPFITRGIFTKVNPLVLFHCFLRLDFLVIKTPKEILCNLS